MELQTNKKKKKSPEEILYLTVMRENFKYGLEASLMKIIYDCFRDKNIMLSKNRNKHIVGLIERELESYDTWRLTENRQVRETIKLRTKD